MSLSSEDALRLRRLRIPTNSMSFVGLGGCAFGFLVAWFLSGVVLSVIASALESLVALSSELESILVLGGGAVIAAATVIYFVHLAHASGMKFPPFRSARLSRLADSSEFRAPHRHLERILRSFLRWPGAIERYFQFVPPRDVMLVTTEKPFDVIEPEGAGMGFEPIRIKRLREGDGGKATLFPRAKKPITFDSAAAGMGEGSARRFLGVVGWCAWGAFVLYMLIDSASRGTLRDFAFPMVFATCAVFTLTWKFFYAEHEFLVPGGIVFRTDAAWRRGQEVSLVTPASSPLFIDFRDGTAMVLDRGKVRSFTCDESTRWLLLAGWQSTARTPTLEEVKTFLGAGQDE